MCFAFDSLDVISVFAPLSLLITLPRYVQVTQMQKTFKVINIDIYFILDPTKLSIKDTVVNRALLFSWRVTSDDAYSPFKKRKV